MNYLEMSDKKLVPVVWELNTLLADYHIYYQNLRNFHWNILGKNFFELHERFEQLYTDAREKIDEIAERILTLQYHPISRYGEYMQISSIEECSGLKSDEEMIEEIIRNHTILLRQMKIVIINAQNVGDEGTLDLIGGYIRKLEKSSWMLAAWSKKPKEYLDTAMLNPSK